MVAESYTSQLGCGKERQRHWGLVILLKGTTNTDSFLLGSKS